MNNLCYARSCEYNNPDCSCMYGDRDCKVNCCNCIESCKKNTGDRACSNFKKSNSNDNIDMRSRQTLEITYSDNRDTLNLQEQARKESDEMYDRYYSRNNIVR